jgi:hypothetical protein
VQGVTLKNRGYLRGVVGEKGEKFFSVDRNGGFAWVVDKAGMELSKHVVGELPTLILELILCGYVMGGCRVIPKSET